MMGDMVALFTHIAPQHAPDGGRGDAFLTCFYLSLFFFEFDKKQVFSIHYS
jgi:hypothetical protein